MTSSATPVVSLRPGTPDEWLEFGPRYRPARHYWEDTRLVGIDPGHTSGIVVLERTFDGWNAIGANATAIGTTRFAELLAGFCPAVIRPTRDGARYSNAAAELKDLLAPELTVTSVAAMCGVSERGFYNWLDGKGIRESRSRRLLEVRALVRAQTLQMGRDNTIAWLQRPHPDLDFESPLDVIKRGEMRRVLPLAIQTRAPRRPLSIIPFGEDVDEQIDTTEILAEQGRLNPEVYDLL